MKVPSLIAAGLAALSLNAAIPNNAYGEPPENPDSTKCAEGQTPPCYLTQEHFDYLEKRIFDLKELIEKLKQDLAQAKSEEKATEEPLASQIATLQTRIAENESRLAALEEQRAAAEDSPQGLRWTFMLRARGAVATPSNNSAVQADLEASIGYRDKATGLGAEAGFAPGLWFTEGVAPVSPSARLGLTGSWPIGDGKELGFVAGGQYSFLGAPDGEGGYTLGTLGAALRVKIGKVCAQVSLDTPAASELGRTSGPFLGAGLGYCGGK